MSTPILFSFFPTAWSLSIEPVNAPGHTDYKFSLTKHLISILCYKTVVPQSQMIKAIVVRILNIYWTEQVKI